MYKRVSRLKEKDKERRAHESSLDRGGDSRQRGNQVSRRQGDRVLETVDKGSRGCSNCSSREGEGEGEGVCNGCTLFTRGGVVNERFH